MRVHHLIRTELQLSQMMDAMLELSRTGLGLISAFDKE